MNVHRAGGVCEALSKLQSVLLKRRELMLGPRGPAGEYWSIYKIMLSPLLSSAHPWFAAVSPARPNRRPVDPPAPGRCAVPRTGGSGRACSPCTESEPLTIFIYYPATNGPEEIMKTHQEIESILRDEKPILKQRFNVKEIGIFGSFVRGEQKDTSDLDLLIDFEEPIGLIRYVGLQNYLSDRIGERVDLVTKSGLKKRISGHALKEVIYL